MTIRRLLAADAPLFRALRLEALRDYPDYYTSTYHEEAAEPERFHAAMLEEHMAYGAWDGEALMASAIAGRHAMRRLRHKCTISAVYVAHGHQGRGIGRALLATLLEAAAEEFEQALIAVDTGNVAGIHLYESLGFERFGVEMRALKDGDRYLDDLWLRKDLRASV